MIRLKDIKLSLDEDIIMLKRRCAKKLGIKENLIKEIQIRSESLDARHKPQLFWVYTVDVEVDHEHTILKQVHDQDVFMAPNEKYSFQPLGKAKLTKRPIIVGMGPAGLFCGYLLAELGYQPLLIDRGECIDARLKTVTNFWQTGQLNCESNVQFGEGGAGTFSDGKLTTQIKDPKYRKQKVLDVFINCGADKKISYMHRPHIGTDKLQNIVKKMREKIIAMGGEFQYQTCLTDIKTIDNKVTSIELNHRQWIDTDIVVLALGHSARDTFALLYDHQLVMEAKPFALGVRIQHPQSLINMNQYGLLKHPRLENASYKLTYKASNNRGVYSFCMCPGGYVVNASSEQKRLAINGMSNQARDTENANSAIIVTVSPEDFGHNPLDGVNFQQRLEEKAYQIGNGNIPIQLLHDYKKNKVTKCLGNIKPIFKGSYTLANLNTIFPDYVNVALKEAITYFGHQIKHFDDDDVILAAIESRTSSPVRLIRSEDGISSIDGVYPCGEGAGYAGGIMSAAIDGIKVAEWIANKYSPLDKIHDMNH